MQSSIRMRREKEERKQREGKQQKQAQERAQLQKDIQEKKLEQLNNWVEGWERAKRMRHFISNYAENSRSWPTERQLQCREWIDWAPSRLTESTHSFLKSQRRCWTESTN
jgi:hypothetical protein